jgi:hypothetical protein
MVDDPPVHAAPVQFYPGLLMNEEEEGKFA